jgi:hypothetical protein
MSASSQTIRGLYRSFLRTGSQFANPNFRDFAIRRTRYEFRLTTSETPEQRLSWAQEQLQTLSKQVIVSNLYSSYTPAH